jgi:hypothetical protein
LAQPRIWLAPADLQQPSSQEGLPRRWRLELDCKRILTVTTGHVVQRVTLAYRPAFQWTLGCSAILLRQNLRHGKCQVWLLLVLLLPQVPTTQPLAYVAHTSRHLSHLKRRLGIPRMASPLHGQAMCPSQATRPQGSSHSHQWDTLRWQRWVKHRTEVWCNSPLDRMCYANC